MFAGHVPTWLKHHNPLRILPVSNKSLLWRISRKYFSLLSIKVLNIVFQNTDGKISVSGVATGGLDGALHRGPQAQEAPGTWPTNYKYF